MSTENRPTVLVVLVPEGAQDMFPKPQPGGGPVIRLTPGGALVHQNTDVVPEETPEARQARLARENALVEGLLAKHRARISPHLGQPVSTGTCED